MYLNKRFFLFLALLMTFHYTYSEVNRTDDDVRGTSINGNPACYNTYNNYTVSSNETNGCVFKYTWTATGGKFSNGANTVTANNLTSVNVFWNSGEDGYKLELSAFQATIDDCTPESVTISASIVPTFSGDANIDPPLNSLIFIGEEIKDNSTFICAVNGQAKVKEDFPDSDYDIETKISYVYKNADGDPVGNPVIVKNWSSGADENGETLEPTFTNLRADLSFTYESRYANCANIKYSKTFDRTFYKTFNATMVGVPEAPKCDNTSGSVIYKISDPNIPKVTANFFIDTNNDGDGGDEQSYTANAFPYATDSENSYFKFDNTLPVNDGTHSLLLTSATWTVQISTEEFDDPSEYPCSMNKQFTIGNPPSILFTEDPSADKAVLNCRTETTDIDVEVTTDAGNSIDYKLNTDETTHTKKGKSYTFQGLTEGTYNIVGKYSDCSFDSGPKTDTKTITIDYHVISFSNRNPVPEDMSHNDSDNDYVLKCHDGKGEVIVTANNTENGDITYRLYKIVNEVPIYKDEKYSIRKNTSVKFENLDPGKYEIGAKHTACLSWLHEGVQTTEEFEVTAPPPITVSAVNPSNITKPTCSDSFGSITFSGNGGNGGLYIESAVINDPNSTPVYNNTMTIGGLYEGAIIEELTVMDSEGCDEDIDIDDITMPSADDPLRFTSDPGSDNPVELQCFDTDGEVSFSYTGQGNGFSYSLFQKNDPCLDNPNDPDCEPINVSNDNIELNADSKTYTFSNDARNSDYQLVIYDDDCSVISKTIHFDIRDQPSMANPKVNEAEGGIELGGNYYVQCKDDSISITWPINFDSNSGKKGGYTIKRDETILIKNDDYTVYADSIVLHDANVNGGTSVIYQITGEDGDDCRLSDDNNSFELKQAPAPFQLDNEKTKMESLYADKNEMEYHLIHAGATDGKAYIAAKGGLTLTDPSASANYTYELYETGQQEALNNELQNESGDLYYYEGLQAQKNYRIDVIDKLGCLKTYSFELNAPDTIKIETTLNTSYAGGVNIACENGTDTVKVQTSGGLYPHFVELKSGENTYFSQTINSSEDTVVFPNVSAGNYYIQVTDKYDEHYANEVRYETQFENFDMLEPADPVDFQYEMQKPTCFYSLDGELTITPSGGIPFENDEYVMMFYNQSGTLLLDSIRGTSATYIDSAGFYRVEVYDANSFNYNTSCLIKDSVLEIKNIPQLKTDTLYSDYPLCLGDSTGKIHVRATGGRSKDFYSFELYDSTQNLIDSLILADTNQHTFENLFSGQYTVKIYDEESCEFSKDIYLKEREDPLSIVNLQPIESTCSNTIDAAIDITTTGGDGMHSLSIDQGQNWVQLDSGNYTYRFDSLTGGQLYEIWLKDENYYENSYQSSCLIIDTVSIARTDSVMLSSVIEQVSCFGGNDGSIKINPSYGKNTNSSNFSFEWYKNDELLEEETSDQLENLSRGSYTVKVTYGTISCSQKSLDIGISQPTQPFSIESIKAQDNNCETNAPLKVQLDLSGGWISQKYKVQLDNLIPDSVQVDEFNSLPIYENLDYGGHKVTVWDGKGCAISDSFTIENQKPVIELVEVSNVGCNGDATGSVKVSGQYEIMDYYLLGNQLDTVKLQAQHRDSVLINGLAAGKYKVWTEKGNCISDTISLNITEPTKLAINPYIVSEATCGKNNGQLDVNIEGGTAPYSINWLNSIDPNAVGLGDYRVTVEDSLGCSLTSEIRMLEVSPISITIDSLKSSYCDLNNGYAEVSISGVTPPYSIYWNGIKGEASKSGLSPGFYQVEVLDAIGCIKSTSFEIEEPLPVTANVVEYREADCDIANGYIQFEYENLHSPYNIIWPETLNPQDDFSANGLVAGKMYSLQIIDSADCNHEFTFSIPDKSDLTIDFEIKRPSCENNNGIIKAQVSGGSGDYDLLWSTGEENTDSVANLSAGFYYLTVEDALGCKVLDSVSLIDDPTIFPDYEIITSYPTCEGNDGDIEIQFLEQSHNFEVYWPASSTVSSKIENLTAGIYEAEIRNGEGCIKTVTIELEAFQKPTLEVESIKMPACGSSNGEILITESAELKYVWSDPIIGDTTHALNLAAGNYWVYGETKSQCKTDTLFFTLDNVDSDLLIQTQSIISNSCPNSKDGSIQINVSGGIPPYSYLWNDDAQQTQAEALNLKSGNYTVLVTDANECSTSKSFTLQSENPVFIASFEQVEPQCSDSYDGSLTVNVGGGKGNYTYEWSNGDTTPTADSLAVGTHSIKVYDGTSCFAFEEVVLSGPAPISLALENGAPNCRGEATGYANLNISGGSGEYDVLWEDGNTLEARSDLAAGSHLVSVQDVNGCEGEFEVIIPEQKDISTEYTVIEPSCNGGSNGRIEINRIFNANNPLVEWQNGETGVLLNNLSSGQYIYTITDNNNCAIQDTILVGAPAPLQLVNLNLQNPLCYGQSTGSISFDVAGGSGAYQYFWGDGFVDKNRSSLKDGSYELTIQDGNGCSLTKEFVLNQPDTISIDYEVELVSCFGNSDGAIDLDISGGVGGYKVTWNDNVTSTDRDNLVAGAYFVTVSDSNGCTNSKQIVVTEPSPLDIEVSKQQPSCNGGADGQLTVEINGGNSPYEIEWQDGTTANTLDSLTTGSYSIEIIDAKGCEFSTSITLNQPSVVRVSEEITENPICYQEPTGYAKIVPTGGVDNYRIEWHDGDTLFQRNDLIAGVHTYTIYDGNGCSYNDQITLEDPDEINIEGLPEEVYLCGSGTLILDGGEKWTEYEWTSNNGFSEKIQEVEITQEGTYTLNTINEDGCTDEYTFEVYKDDNLIDTDFLLTSDAIVGDTVIMVDVSWPVPDSTFWDNGDNPDLYVVSQNENYQEVIFTKAGDYEVGMTAHISLCQDYIRKTIKVMSPEVAEMQKQMQEQLGTSMNLEVNVFPNPNYGRFRIESELNEKQDIKIHIFDLNKGRVITSISGKESKNYVFDIDDQSLPEGVYLIMAESEGKTITKKFIVE